MRRLAALTFASVVTLMTMPAASVGIAQEKPKLTAALTPEAAGRDFERQGEYTGELDTDDGTLWYGVQIIAQGDGRFHAVAYAGGLPGGGWDCEEKVEVDGDLQGDEITFLSENGKATLRNGKLVITNADGNELGSLEKVVRKSPTLGLKPPEGAVVLFDGKDVNRFKGNAPDEGLLVQGQTSTELVEDCTLHLEFLLSFMPQASGQARANSGCYLQGRYEVQILDSFGLAGQNNECGGVYNIKAPDVNMCFPPLSWQTYDIDFTAAKYDDAGKKTANARITVRHNGIVIHKDVEIPEATRAAPVAEGPEPGPIYLQDHGNPIRFRNIWLVKK